MTQRTVGALAAIALALVVASPAARADDPPKASRADLAAAYLRFERAYLADPREGAERARLNRAFDRATIAFFTGRNADAIRTLDRETAGLAVPEAKRGAWLAAVATAVRVETPVIVAGRREPILARVGRLYPVDGDAELAIRIVAPDGSIVVERPLGDATDRVALPVAGARPGLHEVRVVAGDLAVPVARLHVVERSLAAVRADNERLLEKLGPDAPPHAVACARARNALLVDRPSSASSAQFLADLGALAADVSAEVAALLEGHDPYRRRTGDLWRVLTVGDRTLPFRVYAPDAAAGEEPRPLVVVLHGMGGDENMFLEGYGAGRIRALADEHGFVVASPRTGDYLRGGEDAFPALIDRLAEDFAIDRRRVHVLGHSMGAGAVAALLREHPERIAAGCMLAGGGAVGPDAPPALVIRGALDPIARGGRGGSREGVEVRIGEGYGHTLLVAGVLPDAVAWLLERRLPAPEAPPAPRRAY